MITKQKSTTYTTEDGQTFDTIEKAQEHELNNVLGIESAASAVMACRDKVLAILCATGRKPRARKGAKKPKTQPATP